MKDRCRLILIQNRYVQGPTLCCNLPCRARKLRALSTVLGTERENIKEKKLTRQDVNEQNEKKTTSTNETCEKHNSKSENEKKMQTQNFDKIITNEHTRRRKSIIRAQLSTTFVSIAILKKKTNYQ